MKNVLLFLLLLPLSASAGSGSIFIKGKVENAANDTLRLLWLPHHFADREQQVTVLLDKKKNYAVTLQQSTPVYLNISYGNTSWLLYALPGDTLLVDLKGKADAYKPAFAGKRAADNTMLQEYMDRFKDNRKDIEQHLRNDSAFAFRNYRDTLEQRSLRFIRSRRSSISPAFYYQLTTDVRYACNLDKLSYLKRNRMYSIRPGEEETALPGYFNFIYRRGIINDSALVSPAYTRFIDGYLFYSYLRTVNFSRGKMNVTSEELFSYAKIIYDGKTLEQELVNLLRFALTREETKGAELILAELQQHKFDTAIINPYERQLIRLKAFGPGALAPVFTLTDVNGKTVSLSDFRGKPVYLDFWASWCGPCMREMPSSAELKKKFAGKDIVFLYVSLDTDEQKWRDAIKNKNIEGIHLIVGKSDVVQNYRISSIPRYFIINRKGELVDINAPRPSDKSLEGKLNELLVQ
jgi:thiol-disulfide isomerase/thioredoxin